MHSSVPPTIAFEQECEILEAVRSGQSGRFEELVLAYQNRLFGSMFAVLGNRQDAEDITQEAFTRAYTKLDAFQAKSSFFTWLHRIAFNLAIDLRRRGNRERQSGKVEWELACHELLSAAPEPSAESERREMRQQIYQALAMLDAERRSIIVLRDLQGMDYCQIAEALEIPIGTVRSRLHRARLELKDLLEQVLVDPNDERPAAMKGAHPR